jgi:DNA polymerase III sliding clamp (beta) subunit (PCNA family)
VTLASNGKRAAQAGDCPVPSPVGEHETLLPVKAACHLAKVLRAQGAEKVRAQLEGDRSRFVAHGATGAQVEFTIRRRSSLGFPASALQKIFAEDCAGRLEAPVKQLVEAATRARWVDREMMRFHLAPRGCFVEAGEEGELRIPLLGKYRGPKMVTGFRPTYLLELLRPLAGPRVEVCFVGGNRPLMVREGDYQAVLMPMHLDK